MKGVPHYTKDGKEYKGKTHKMKDGSLHTGKTHTTVSYTHLTLPTKRIV